jgi:uncharacterized membrane protein YczE
MAWIFDPVLADLRLSPGALARLLLAHPPCGAGIALLIRSGLGAAPWDVFHLGLHRATGLGVGVATTLTAVAALLLALVWGVPPGLGTVVNLLLLGICIDAALAMLPAAAGAVSAVGYLAAGLLLFGLGTGLYLSAEAGSGPRDSLMVAIARRRHWPVWRARLLLELLALSAGVALGAGAGVGTLVYALAIGPVAQWGITLFAERA